MGSLPGALLLSLFTGYAAGLDPDTALDPLVSALLPQTQFVAEALDARVGHLQDSPAHDLATESLTLLAPLAERLGLDDRRAQLEDASFHALQPEVAAALAASLPSPQADAALLDSVSWAAHTALADLGLDGVVTSRVKSLYSTHRKMERKGVGLDSISDRVAVRVRVDEVEDCYRVLDAVHDQLAPLPSELDDYIASPKASGYRSLHTSVWVPTSHGGFVAEVQIRTHAMHDAAESGDQAHWRYKHQA